MTTPEQEALAKKRFMALNLVRIFALIMIVVGMLFVTDKVEIPQPPRHIIGLILILIGIVDYFVMPRILVKRWKSPEA